MPVISLNTLFTPYADHKTYAAFCGNGLCEISGKREKRQSQLHRQCRLIPLFSLFPQYASKASNRLHAVHPTVAKWHSQPTRCGHTLTRCPLPGLAGDYSPRPHKAQGALPPVPPTKGMIPLEPHLWVQGHHAPAGGDWGGRASPKPTEVEQ